METRAHFVIVGLFTLLGIIGGLASFIWLASVQIDRQYTQYGMLFENVSGLSQSADVLFNGVNVGRVVGIRIWETDPSKVYVAVEVDAGTPIAVDTIAQLESQGVTGVAYIALAGGSPGAASLTPETDGVPIIASRQSSFQSLVNSAPDLLGDAAILIKQLEDMTGPENQDHVRRVLENLDGASAELDTALSDFAEISETLKNATAQITAFTDDFEGVGSAVQATLRNADTSLAAVTQAAEKADQTIDTLGPTIESADATLKAISRFVAEDLSPLAADTERTLQSVDAAFAQANRIMATDIGPALTDARAALATLTTDAPAIMTDLGTAIAEGRASIAAATRAFDGFGQVSNDARTFMRRLNDVARRIEQNPTDFLLESPVPDYRR